MAKKGTRSAKVSQQRAREEQWKRRLGTQAQGDAGMLVADGSRSDDENIPAGPEPATPTSTMIFAPRSAVSRSSATSATTRPSTAMRATNTATAAATQRRAAAAARTARTRATSTAMSVDDEMYYVRSDIRRLIMLTVVCVLVLILLFFLIPR